MVYNQALDSVCVQRDYTLATNRQPFNFILIMRCETLSNKSMRKFWPKTDISWCHVIRIL